MVVAAVAAVAVPAAAAPPASARVEQPQFVVALAGPTEARAGGAAALEVTVTARGGYHLNKDYPSSFRVAADGEGVTYPSPKVDKFALEACTAAPGESCAARAQVPFVAARPGAQRVGGTLAFCVCNADECLIQKIAVGREVTVR
jgi:hypothetical protein